ncbi:hypothetical protein ACHAXA_006791 [Cyclostephanos tholiformis]|uniref:Uncharacterized protein n=1 Tax=Cyclostephanos tholiformis TaxID=382380 RepID=A0ABD3RQS1_9STRA
MMDDGNAARYPTLRCIVIDREKTSLPPPPPPSTVGATIPHNENSTRAYAKRFRVFAFREFLLRTYFRPSSLSSSGGGNDGAAVVLDVAGGNGHLSWILRNADGINSIVVDPVRPKHDRLIKSMNFLIDHPDEAALRSVEGLPTHQPLARLMPSLIENCERRDDRGRPIMTSPSYMRIRVDSKLVAMLRKVIVDGPSSGGDDALRSWDAYWYNESVNSANVPEEDGKSFALSDDSQICDSRRALEVFRSVDLIVGFHPDQATEAIIDMALLLRVPFAVVPCCVFPSEFPERTLGGKRVRIYSELVEYLRTKHDGIRTTTLPFIATEFARKLVMYMLMEDFK